MKIGTSVIKVSYSRAGAREDRRYARSVARARLLKLRRKAWRQDDRS